MKTPHPASVTAAFVSALLSLTLPASAASREEVVQPHRESAPIHAPVNDRARDRALGSDPILKSTWGPGEADLVVPKFHFTLGSHPAKAPSLFDGLHR